MGFDPAIFSDNSKRSNHSAMTSLSLSLSLSLSKRQLDRDSDHEVRFTNNS